MSAGNWRVQFEFKTGGYENTGGGDYRFITNVMKGSEQVMLCRTHGGLRSLKNIT